LSLDTADLTPTRGERNNNPGNVRSVGGVVWQGQSIVQDDLDFVVFKASQYGIRAIARILRTYKFQGLTTISQAIARWAPGSENDTNAYVTDVCDRCGIAATDVVDFDAIIALLVKAIIWHENGRCIYGDDVIHEGIELAL
jgi:hypothetical protein